MHTYPLIYIKTYTPTFKKDSDLPWTFHVLPVKV